MEEAAVVHVIDNGEPVPGGGREGGEETAVSRDLQEAESSGHSRSAQGR